MSGKSNFIAVICGLKSEAQVVSRVLDASKIRVGVSGANAARAEEVARQFCEAGATAIISVGVSGGLDPSLAPGDLIIGDRVLCADGNNYQSDRCLLDAIADAPAAAKAKIGALFGADDIIESIEKKAALFHEHRVLGVDMESHGAARAAASAGVAFLAIRAIADPADRALPPAALGAVAPDGSTRMLATLGAAMRDPKQFPALMKLGADSSAALKTLRRDLVPLFGRLFLSCDL
jgi:adenosylhomocysteine nucleosidase